MAVSALTAHAEAAVVTDVPVGISRLALAAPLAGNLLRVADVGKEQALVVVAGGVPPNGIHLFLCLSLIRCLGKGNSANN